MCEEGCVGEGRGGEKGWEIVHFCLAELCMGHMNHDHNRKEVLGSLTSRAFTFQLFLSVTLPLYTFLIISPLPSHYQNFHYNFFLFSSLQNQ